MWHHSFLSPLFTLQSAESCDHVDWIFSKVLKKQHVERFVLETKEGNDEDQVPELLSQQIRNIWFCQLLIQQTQRFWGERHESNTRELLSGHFELLNDDKCSSAAVTNLRPQQRFPAAPPCTSAGSRPPCPAPGSPVSSSGQEVCSWWQAPSLRWLQRWLPAALVWAPALPWCARLQRQGRKALNRRNKNLKWHLGDLWPGGTGSKNKCKEKEKVRCYTQWIIDNILFNNKIRQTHSCV